MFYSENIVIFAILMRYVDISVIGFLYFLDIASRYLRDISPVR